MLTERNVKDISWLAGVVDSLCGTMANGSLAVATHTEAREALARLQKSLEGAASPPSPTFLDSGKYPWHDPPPEVVEMAERLAREQLNDPAAPNRGGVKP